jgi:hypothetical protein
MHLYLEINYKNQHNDKLYNLFKQNYADDKEFPPDYQYRCILSCDYWFTMYDDKNNIIASCSVSKENHNIFEINDVLVEEKFRGNNYSILLIMNVLYYFEQNFDKKLIIKIISEINSDAYYCYKKIFGDEYRSDNRYAYFSYNM